MAHRAHVRGNGVAEPLLFEVRWRRVTRRPQIAIRKSEPEVVTRVKNRRAVTIGDSRRGLLQCLWTRHGAGPDGPEQRPQTQLDGGLRLDRKSTRLNSS